MTSYRYLGYGVTNSNGVAHLDHDPQGNPINGYTGTGAGEVDVIASTDNPVSSGSIVSVPCSVWDTLIYDSGINDGHKNTNVTIGTNVTEQVLDDGTVLECTNGTSLVNAQYTYNQQITGDFEAIITVTTSSAIRIGFFNGSNSARIQISNVSNRQYKISRIGTEWTAQYWNGTQWVDLSYWDAKTLTDEDCKFYFYLYSANDTRSVKFTDLKIYSI